MAKMKEFTSRIQFEIQIGQKKVKKKGRKRWPLGREETVEGASENCFAKISFQTFLVRLSCICMSGLVLLVLIFR